MKIVQLAAEFAPLAKAGGLGEVLLGLSRELTRQGEDVEVILPKYNFIDLNKISQLKMEVPDFKCLEKGNLHANAMWSGTSADCEIRLLDVRHPAGERGGVRGFLALCLRGGGHEPGYLCLVFKRQRGDDGAEVVSHLSPPP